MRDIQFYIGETVNKRFTLTGTSDTFVAGDLAVFAVRHKNGLKKFYKILTMLEDDGVVYFYLTLTHGETKDLCAEKLVYGISLFHDPVLDENDFPISGEVIVPIGEANFIVKESASKEKGLR